MDVLPCLIPADPDISGVGVRIAIYAQNLLSFIPAIWALWDGEVSEYELECVETQSTTILVTAFAILISAMVQVSRGLSNFHTSIVLDLSWMNNTNTFIYFLLYIQHKSQPGPQQIEPTFSAWIRHFRHRMAWYSMHERRSADAERTILKPEADASPDAEPESTEPESSKPGTIVSILMSEKPTLNISGTRAAARQKAWFKAGFRRIVMVLGSLHLSLMAGLGIWLWSDPGSFGSTDPCVVNIARVAILGRSVPLASTGLRGWSIAIYSLFLAPGLNLILPAALFLGLFIGYQTWNTSRLSKGAALGVPAVPIADRAPDPIWSAIRAWYDRLPSTPSVCPTVVGMVLLMATNLIFLLDIELTLLRNRAHQTAGESEWTFGQILALLLLVLPLRDLVDTMLARREKRRMDEHATSLRNAIRDKAPMKTILDLVNTGADVNAKVEEDCDYPTALMLAVSRGDEDSVRALLKRGAAPNIRGGKDGSALLSACRNRHVELARLLLQHGADPNVQADEGGTALQAASYQGHVPVVELLLASGADVKIQGGQYGTALQAASYRGDIVIVELLLAHGADVKIQGGQYGTALQAAVVELDIIELLPAHGADVNIQGGSRYGTALQAALYEADIAIVELLLARGANINVQGKHDW
ncbi:ankyrin repeat-containing domain protein [Mycena vitilis]|nr:ankyrin repeat-containing domain protein [Mycena vitilis]